MQPHSVPILTAVCDCDRRVICKALNPSLNYITQEQLADLVTMAFTEHMHFLRKDILAAKAKSVAMGTSLGCFVGCSPPKALLLQPLLLVL
jgi:hypothetical protein